MASEMGGLSMPPLVGRALVAGLCVAAAAAIAGLLTGSWDDTNWKIMGSSLGFSVFTATGSAGTDPRAPRTVGGVAVIASVAAYGCLLLGLWSDDADNLTLWRAFGIAGLLALWSAHAALLLRSGRATDSDAIRTLTIAAITTLGLDALIGILALLEVIDDVSETGLRAIGVLVVLAVLTTLLVPILRRLAPPSRESEIAAVARRLAAMDLPPEAQREVEQLRRLTRTG
jgi:hypothetical protein